MVAAAAAVEGSSLLSQENENGDIEITARKILYVSHFISEFSNQAWQFSLVMFLAAIQHFESFVLVSGYGLTVGLAVVFLGPWAGCFFVDETEWNRLTTLQILIVAQNITTLFACASCYFLLVEEKAASFLNSPILLSTLLFNGSCSVVFSQTITVVLERDWLIVMAGNNTNDATRVLLSTMNVTMRQIDLTCRVVAPAVAGFLIGPVPFSTAVLIVGSLNVVSLVVESVCAVAIYERVPGLKERWRTTSHSSSDPNECAAAVGEDELTAGRWRRMIPRGLQVYLQQRPLSYAGIALSLLYLNSLTFGSLMTAYLLWRGMSLEMVGIWRGVSSSVGLVGTVLYQQNIPVAFQGLWSVWYQLLCVSISFIAVLCVGRGSLVALIGGVVLSRIGLWVFDISVTQLMQQHVPEPCRGSVGGTQLALNSSFQLMAYGLGLIWPNPRDFGFLVATGYVAVVAAALVFTFGLYWQRHKLTIVVDTDNGSSLPCGP